MLRAKAYRFLISEVFEMWLGPFLCILFFTSATAYKKLCTQNQAALGSLVMVSTSLVSGDDRPSGYLSELVTTKEAYVCIKGDFA